MLARRTLLAVLAAVLLFVLPATAPAHDAPVKQPTAVGTGGAAATVDAQGTQAAIDVLRHGGNAVDAAVAAAGVLGVVEPYSCGIGGGGFMTIYSAKDHKVHTIDSRETAPATMGPDAFTGLTTFESQRVSGMSVGVPGTLRAWETALKEFGSISLGDALKPGIEVAKHGFAVDPTFFAQTDAAKAIFADFPATAALYLDADGTPRDVGTTIRNPDLARTYKLIAKQGPAAFYGGPLAQAIVDTVQHPPLRPGATRVARPGLMTLDDLAGYKTVDRDPTAIDYRGLDVYGMAPPSSGGSTVGEALNILEGYDLGHEPIDLATHQYLEASRYSFADRGKWVGDPGYFDVPLEGLLSDSFAAERRALIKRHRGREPGPGRRPARQHGDVSLRHQRVGHARRLDDEHDGHRQVREHRRVHVHDRADRRQRHGRPRLRVPAQQRADRLQPRRERHEPRHAVDRQPDRRRQAAALLDRADDRAARTAGRSSRPDRPAARRSSRPSCRSS